MSKEKRKTVVIRRTRSCHCLIANVEYRTGSGKPSYVVVTWRQNYDTGRWYAPTINWSAHGDVYKQQAAVFARAIAVAGIIASQYEPHTFDQIPDEIGVP